MRKGKHTCRRLLLEDMSSRRRECQGHIVSVEVSYRSVAMRVGVLTAQVGIPLMESAEVVERMERLRKRTIKVKRGMELEIGSRILNIADGVESRYI